MVVVEGDDILPEQGAVKRVVSEGERHFLEKTREGEFFLEEGVWKKKEQEIAWGREGVNCLKGEG